MRPEEIGSPSAAAPLARLLAKPGMRGHAMTKLGPLYDEDMELRRRLGPLGETAVARATLARDLQRSCIFNAHIRIVD